MCLHIDGARPGHLAVLLLDLRVDPARRDAGLELDLEHARQVLPHPDPLVAGKSRRAGQAGQAEDRGNPKDPDRG